MQQDYPPNEQPTHIRPNRLIKHPHHFITTNKWERIKAERVSDVASRPTLPPEYTMPTHALPNTPTVDKMKPMGLPPNTPSFDNVPPTDDEGFDISVLSTHHLMQLSGMMRAINIQRQQQGNTNVAVEWWPDGIKQTGPVPVVNLYGREPLGKSMPPPSIQAALPPLAQVPTKPQPVWKTVLNTPAVKVMLGLLFGITLLLLISRFVNINTIATILHRNLTTPYGITHALLAAFFFSASFTIRGIRWRLFLSRITNISVFKAIQMFWVAVFINFLLPVQGGEVAKSLMLKRIANVPISQSLPTVAMDKSLDLMPALIIMAIVPFLPGVHMSPILWIILCLVGSILVAVILTVALAAWKRDAAIAFIHFFLNLLPKGIAAKIDGFAMGFVDSLLAGASSPKTFIPAILLTCLSVFCDGAFALMAFLTVGLSKMTFGAAIFGYSVYNMFTILPSAPAQIGSNEGAGEIVFSSLLGFDKNSVLAMFVFSHPLGALIMTSMGLFCLSRLGISMSNALKVKSDNEPPTLASPPRHYEQAERQVAHV